MKKAKSVSQYPKEIVNAAGALATKPQMIGFVRYAKQIRKSVVWAGPFRAALKNNATMKIGGDRRQSGFAENDLFDAGIENASVHNDLIAFLRSVFEICKAPLGKTQNRKSK